MLRRGVRVVMGERDLCVGQGQEWWRDEDLRSMIFEGRDLDI